MTGWRWLFLVVLPIAAVVAVAALHRLENVGEARPGSVDPASVGLAALGFGGLVYGLSGLGSAADAAVSPWAFVAAGIAVVGIFAHRQVRRQDHPHGPLLDLRTLTHRTFSLALALQALAFLTMMGAMILLPLYLQGLRGLTPSRPAFSWRRAGWPWASPGHGSGRPSTAGAPAR